eukprot:NODE_640_length_1887_cov_12.754081_g513_i0.p1 GENE.NODE_640_length_1887_cov_12.754081_g513_i0~~NODE_640_length_1887_cov_12.754081_g513_i0.p1  ORF type:complete len:502 (+),score=121.59 NODE_640_length_1887_cov_12.754081_g513_i0:28-1506(+)
MYDDDIQFERPAADAFESSHKTTIRILDDKDLLEQHESKVQEVVSILCLSHTSAVKLLANFGWSVSATTERYLDMGEDERAAMAKKLGLRDTSEGPSFVRGTAPAVECCVCLQSHPGKETLRLAGCTPTHFACEACWRSHLVEQLTERQEEAAFGSPCLGDSCKNLVDEELFKEVLSAEDFARFRKRLVDKFILTNPNISWCPSCERKVYSSQANAKIVTCECDFSFCFPCNNEAHAPSSCDELKKWREKEQSESETAAYLFVHTKLCPKCKVPGERESGCNHMTCKKCRHDYCWICLGDWSKHGSSYYKCTFSDSEKEQTLKQAQNATRAELEKYVNYFNRYKEHDKSRQFNTKDQQRAQEKVERLRECLSSCVDGVDLEWILKSVNQLVEVRKFLKWVYVHGYYQSSTNAKDIFEFRVQDLEFSTETLNGLINEVLRMQEDDILADKEKSRRLVDLAAAVKRKLSIVQEGTQEWEMQRTAALGAASSTRT